MGKDKQRKQIITKLCGLLEELMDLSSRATVKAAHKDLGALQSRCHQAIAEARGEEYKPFEPLGYEIFVDRGEP